MNFTPQYLIISKIINRISHYWNWVYIFSPLRWITIINIRKQANKLNQSSFVAKLNLIIGTFQNYPEAFKSCSDTDVILHWADKTVNHEFEYLGSGPITLNPIDWHSDFKTGFRWPKGTFYLKYEQVYTSNYSDVKVPWELSRCHHLLWLGEAYLICRDEKYAKELVDQLHWWIDENPLMYSINWTCAMDVSIRAVNWIYAITMISSSTYLTAKALQKFKVSLFEHGWFIYRNLEKWYPYSANHYAANINGLLYLGQLFKDCKAGKKWWDYALKEYFLEVRIQVLPSGAHFERSISYHRLMTELFAYPYFMLQRVNEPIPLDIKLRIQSMFDFIDHYTKPNGLAPQLGDNDDGRFLPFVRRDFRIHNYLLNIASLAFKKNYKNSIAEKWVLDSFFLFPESNLSETYLNSSYGLTVNDHRDAGFVIFKNDVLYFIFSNTSLSCYPDLNRRIMVTHTHADGLSFELSIGKIDFIIDPGAYLYTASAFQRNKFRSTSLHNTITFDDQDQIMLVAKKYFTVKDFDEVEVMDITDNNEGEFCVTGYRKWKLPTDLSAAHSRKVFFRKENEIELIDKIICESEHRIVWHYYLAPEIFPTIVSSNDILLIGPDNLVLNVRFTTSNDFIVEVEDCEVSPSYGIICQTKSLKISVNASSNFFFTTKMFFTLSPLNSDFGIIN